LSIFDGKQILVSKKPLSYSLRFFDIMELQKLSPRLSDKQSLTKMRQ